MVASRIKALSKFIPFFPFFAVQYMRSKLEVSISEFAEKINPSFQTEGRRREGMEQGRIDQRKDTKATIHCHSVG